MIIRSLALAFFFLFTAVGALAQQPADPEEEVVEEEVIPDVLLGKYPESVRQAGETWADAWRATPRLVSLKSPDETLDIRTQLQDRIKLLGEKRFSNREWKGYWELQITTAQALAEEMKKADADLDQLAGIEAWIELANKKVANQDKYFDAIQKERDALKERLEATLESKIPEGDEISTTLDPNPYEKRSIHLAELEHRIEVQEHNRRQVESEVTFIKSQLESDRVLSDALKKDLELAKEELKISLSQENDETHWGQLWQEVAVKSRSKVEKLDDESDYGGARERSRMVELGLAESQIEFRTARISDLNVQYEKDGSIGLWLVATWETILQWAKNSAWKIVIGLFFVYLGMRVALRMTARGVRIILERTDDDPDSDDDGDQRRETLADVFSGVLRIAIYIVGGLIALEQ
ncbi:MAG: hypothetical protein HN348_15770, partial [Proteobacteria bacterium]|nr:hypothetical protein [Pseudomonadota bacterium]